MSGKEEKTNLANQMEWYSEVPRSIRLYSMTGLIVMASTLGGFGIWAATAPLASAIVAQGSFVATGNNKIVQHLEGGIIREMMVSEGDIVKEGDVLLALDQTAPLSNERMLKLRQLRLEAVVARLRAQAEGEPEFTVPDIVREEAGDPDINAIIQGQQIIFNSKRIRLEEQLNLIDKNIRSLQFRYEGYRGQKGSFERQISLLKEERDSKAELVEAGYARKTELFALERAIADAGGEISRLDGQMNESEAAISRYQQEAIIAVNANKQAALDALEVADSDLGSVREQVREAAGVLERTIIRSPVSGTVVRSYYHTAGGVITTGKPIMEILPANVPLILEAQVLRTLIDQLHEGATATVRLSALNRRTTPVLEGKVFYVSADSVEESSGMAVKDVYIIRVAIPDSELAKVHDFHPVPGMPADVLVQTSERTFVEYLTKPITDSMSRAFKER